MDGARFPVSRPLLLAGDYRAHVLRRLSLRNLSERLCEVFMQRTTLSLHQVLLYPYASFKTRFKSHLLYEAFPAFNRTHPVASGIPFDFFFNLLIRNINFFVVPLMYIFIG